MADEISGRPGGTRAAAMMLGAVAIVDGYDVFVPSYVIHYVQGPWGLSPAASGALVSSGLLGFMIGAVLTGPIADRIGRRPALLLALAIAGLGNLAIALWARGFVPFVALRIVSGIGLGMIMPIVTAYLNEILPGRSSNVATVAATSGYTIGGVAAALAGILLTPSLGWSILFHLGWLGCLAALLVLHRNLPESPMFARQAGGSRHGLLARAYRRDSLVLWCGAALALFNIYALSAWIPSVMIARGSSFGLGFLSGAVLQLAGLAGGFACAALADRWGSRRGPLALWYGLLALSLGGLGATALPGLDVALIAASGFFLIGAQPVFNNLAAQTYPTGLRATGVGMTLGIGRIGAVVGPVAIGAIQSASSSDVAVFAVMAGAAAAAALVLLASSDRAIGTGSPPRVTLDRTSGRPTVDAGAAVAAPIARAQVTPIRQERERETVPFRR